MERDVKEVIGVLMRILDGGKISRDEAEDLAFEATGDLRTALNQAYIEILEVAYDQDAGLNDRRVDDETRATLQRSLDKIVHLADPSFANDRD